MHSSDSEHSADDSGAGDDPRQSSSTPKRSLQHKDTCTIDLDSGVEGSSVQKFDGLDSSRLNVNDVPFVPICESNSSILMLSMHILT